jgi:hypothetical protein
MTKRRIFGEDKPMLEWIRAHPELPSYSINHGRTVNDVDFLIHQYMTQVDALGTREIQFMLHIETKSRCGRPDQSQTDTLFKEHMMKRRTAFIFGKQVRHHGVAVLSLSGESPMDSDVIMWGRFQGFGPTPEITFRQITELELLDLITFQRDPDTFVKIDLRRHHKTQRVIKVETSPLGFEVPVMRTQRS